MWPIRHKSGILGACRVSGFDQGPQTMTGFFCEQFEPWPSPAEGKAAGEDLNPGQVLRPISGFKATLQRLMLLA